jgi:hypothetical protein
MKFQSDATVYAAVSTLEFITYITYIYYQNRASFNFSFPNFVFVLAAESSKQFLS